MMLHLTHLNRMIGIAGAALSVALAGCGGGSSDSAEEAGPAPSFAGSYDVTLTKTGDSCGLGLASNIALVQSVSQDGRSISLITNQVTLTGRVDADNAGFSTSLQQTQEGIPVTTTMVYRSTATPGVYGAGFSVVARDSGLTCTISYNGSAKLK